MEYLAIDIGGTFIKYGVINNSNQVKKTWYKKSQYFKDKDLFYDYLCEDLILPEKTIVGVSTAGVIKDGIIVSKASPNLHDMYKTNINYEIKKRLKKDTFTINDAEAAGICETQIGNAKNTSSSVFWIIGTGIGGALFQGSHRILGNDGISGEFSHFPIKQEGNKLQGIGSELSIVGLINHFKKISNEPIDIDGKFIFDEYEKGNKLAILAINNWCKKMVKVFLMITYFYNPEIICIGGAVSQRKWFIEKIQASFEEYEYAMKDLISTKIVGCKYQGEANLLGGVLAAKNYFKNKGVNKWIN
ncbi:ROK family protein [Enterococcus devriesei]|uniref:ROK family protein n=1 Tax=Enterococcus devriesei TaxID=319970 RepID=UPI0036D230B6